MARPKLVVPATCVALAGLSLLLPWGLSFDPWGWVLWGRELTSPHIAFSTTFFPAWKPLPVLFTTPFSLFGAAGPELWLFVARLAALAAVVLAYRLGARLGGRAAGMAAAAGVLLMPESLRHFAGGASEPLLVALVLGAIDRHLAGRSHQALALGFAAALVRPEAWPFLAIYGVAYAWHRPRRVPVVLALGLALAALWFVPEWIGAGDPFYGAWLGRVSKEARDTQSLASPALAALGRAATLTLLPLGLGALFAVGAAIRERRRLPLVLAAGALAWVAIVVVMAARGYAGLGRFSLPAAAVVCVLGGAGIAELVRLTPVRLRPLAAVALMLASVPFVVLRVAHIAPGFAAATAGDRVEDTFPAVVARLGGAARTDRCKRIRVDGLFSTAAAWHLGVPIGRVAKTRHPMLVLRVTHRVIPGFTGPERLQRLVPVRPARRIADVKGWEALASRHLTGCRLYAS